MNTQKISKKDLQTIYTKVCDGWKKVIAELVLFQEDSMIEVENDLILKAHKEADPAQKKLIEKYFKIISNDIRDKIKSLDDVYYHLGINREDVITYKKPKNKLQKAANAFIDINHISLALNETWKVNFLDRNQPKYYPYFERKSSGWVVGVDGVCYYGVSGLGSGCFYKSSEIARYAAETFPEVYEDYLPE